MNSVRQLWLRWKMLRLPWRKRFLVGLDLQGNTFWEFKDALSSDPNRMRRIVKYPYGTHHGDVEVNPLWHQWLRHTRIDPPTIREQQVDVARVSQLRQNALLADQRWAAKEKYIEAPRKREPKAEEGPRQEMEKRAGVKPPSNPGQNWQPEAWTPAPSRRKT